MSEADILVGHNIDKFDVKKCKTRFAAHGLPVLPKIRTADTYKIARNEFSFSSNRLDYICKYLGIDGKFDTSKGLWEREARGGEEGYEAVVEMYEYNKQDVRINEELYLKLRPWDKKHPNISLLVNDGKGGDKACPKCGSTHLHKKDERFIKSAGGRFQRYDCQGCGSVVRGSDNLLSKKHTGTTIASKKTIGA
jgi:hypothetical protein